MVPGANYEVNKRGRRMNCSQMSEILLSVSVLFYAGPATSVLPGNLLTIQILGPYPKPRSGDQQCAF